MSVITEEVMAQCVAKEFGVDVSKVKIKAMEKTRGSSAGDGFVCEIWRFDINAIVDGIEKPSLNYVAKTCPEDAREKMMREAQVTDCEVWFYDNLAPKLQALRKAANLEPLKFPRVYYTNKENGAIVMENLKNKFGLVPKSPKGISRDCVEKLLMELAAYHATTYHFLQMHPGGMKSLLESQPYLRTKSLFELFPSMEEMNKKFLVQSMTTTSAIIAKAGNKELSCLVKKQEGLINDAVRKAAVASPDCKFKTLIHGDFWYNNIMVKLDDDQNLLDFCFIDFQIVMLNSVAIDVQYFLAASANMDDKAKYFDKWMSLYHNSLTKSLVDLGYQETLYPFEDFLKDIKSAGYHALAFGLMHCNMHIIGSGIDNPFENQDMMKGKSMEEVSKIYDEFMENIAEHSRTIPGLWDRIVALAKESAKNGTI